MGMEVLEEFRPVTPLRTLQVTGRSGGLVGHGRPQPQDSSVKLAAEERDTEEECQTPTSAGSLLKSSMVCPPAPKKPRPPRRKLNFPPPPFFAAPQDLSSVYIELQTPSKKIRAI